MRTASTRFDLFDEAPGDRQTPRPAPKKRGSDAAPQPSNWTDEEAARRLEASGQYRILRRLVPRPILPQRQSLLPDVAVLVDVETRGLQHSRDEVIEIGAVAFTYDCDGGIGAVVGVYSGLRQPSVPFPTEITRLTAARTRWSRARTSTLLPATRSSSPRTSSSPTMRGVDRPFCEKLSSAFVPKAWASSVTEIRWADTGFEGNKLGYLVGQSGLFHEGHRATDDCRGLLEVLPRPAGEEGTCPLFRAARERAQPGPHLRGEFSLRHEGSPEGEGLSMVGRERRAAEGLVDRDR